MNLRRLLLGFAAVLATSAGANAIEPVEYVRICDAFGTGFYYIPGTDTCLRISGRVRVDAYYVDGDVNEFPQTLATYGTANTVDFNNYSTLARGAVRFDARTQTDFGLIRAFMEMEMDVSTAGYTESGAANNPNRAGTGVNLASAFLQVSRDWGTITSGHTASFFDFFGSHGYGGVVNIDDPTGEQTLSGFTFAFTPGWSATLAAEDPSSGGRRLNGDDDYEGQEGPDFVGNIRIDQGWGSAQIMGAFRRIHDITDDGFGWAVGAGLSIGIPGGWKLEGQGGYSEGAIAYVTSDPGPGPVGFGIGDFNGPDGDDTNTAWSVRGGITGPFFNPMVVAWLDGSFTHAEEADGDGPAVGDSYDWFAVKAGFEWMPSEGLTIGPQVTYANVDGDDAGEDGDIFQAMMRIQRDF